MENKKQYIAPTLKCVQCKVEKGYNVSDPRQGLSTPFGNNDDFNRYKDDPSSFEGNRFGSYFTGNTDDWD